MTDEEIVEAMAAASWLSRHKMYPWNDPNYGPGKTERGHYLEGAAAAFAIAKPLIAREARERALKEARKIAEAYADEDLAYAKKYPDEGDRMNERRWRALTIASAIGARSDLPEVTG